MDFASDNGSGATQDMMDALRDANKGFATAYGDDRYSEALDNIYSEVFECPVRVFSALTGTAANCMALAAIAAPHSMILAHRNSHLLADEAAAPELITSARLWPLDGEDGLISETSLSANLVAPLRPLHTLGPTAISFTQPNEVGRGYEVKQFKMLCAMAREKNLKLHVDGARFANALAKSGESPAEATWRNGVDVLSLGVTKNGGFGVEAVVFFDLEAADRFSHIQKRAGHLQSKMRFASAQLAAYVKDDAWLETAQHANAMASRLSQGLTAMPGIELLYATDINMVFVSMPEDLAKSLWAEGAHFYALGGKDGNVTARLVCSFQNTADEVDRFLELAAVCLNTKPV